MFTFIVCDFVHRCSCLQGSFFTSRFVPISVPLLEFRLLTRQRRFFLDGLFAFFEQFRVLQCSGAQCSGAQCSEAQCSEEQCSETQCSGTPCSEAQCGGVPDTESTATFSSSVIAAISALTWVRTSR